MGRLSTIWSGPKYYLDKMSLGDLTVAYFLYPAILAYIGLLGLSGVVIWSLARQGYGQGIPILGLVVVVTAALYPFVEYALHRFLLHGRFMYKSPRTAAVWKRIHYDHHQDPNDLRILFGALYTTLPTIVLVTIPVGVVIGGAQGAAVAFATGLVCMLVYEFFHCVHHLRYTPRFRFLRRLKQTHLLHHFHNENGNYGITTNVLDVLGGTYYAQAGDVPRSDTVYNLGYAEEECMRYPWVAQLSGARE